MANLGLLVTAKTGFFLVTVKTGPNWALFSHSKKAYMGIGGCSAGVLLLPNEGTRSVVATPITDRIVRSGALPDRTFGSYRGPKENLVIRIGFLTKKKKDSSMGRFPNMSTDR